MEAAIVSVITAGMAQGGLTGVILVFTCVLLYTSWTIRKPIATFYRLWKLTREVKKGDPYRVIITVEKILPPGAVLGESEKEEM